MTITGISDNVHPARRVWAHLELIHAVTYFAPECADALTEVGLKGFWMGYFGARGAALGPVGPAVIEATFYNFAPAMVQRAIPDAWRFAPPAAILEARATSAAMVLRRLLPTVESHAIRILPLLQPAVRAGRPDGRPLFAANQALAHSGSDPVAELWQCATTLREHRGDGHVSVLVANDISGLEAHQLMVADGRIGDDRLRTARGWNEDEWAAAKDRLRSRGLLGAGGVGDGLTEAGGDVVARIESITDDLAAQPFRDGLTETGMELLPSLLRPIADAVTESGLVPFPNPIGVPEGE